MTTMPDMLLMLMLAQVKQRLQTEGSSEAAMASSRYLAPSLYSLGVFPVARLNALVK
ncbi:hypothetical protein BN871_BQ_00030 [Paenibacillus sp. P22]|nr:hypothetical protein BN871_BQ_00030 [Paenibacillus sp. P22]